jgi:hypothetical protein
VTPVAQVILGAREIAGGVPFIDQGGLIDDAFAVQQLQKAGQLRALIGGAGGIDTDDEVTPRTRQARDVRRQRVGVKLTLG